MTVFLELNKLGKSYPTPQGEAVIVENFNLLVHKGEFICIIGHSGCGKSTVLSMVMGLLSKTEGGIVLDGHDVEGPGTDRGVVFQHPSLLPWMSALENVRLAVEQVRPSDSREAANAIAQRCLERVGLASIAKQFPDELSAGMKQRVAIARALALDPRALLLDEPFSLLDVFSRMELQDEIMRLWEEDKKTVLMVTHDVDEALLLADRIVMMTAGPAATIGDIMTVPFERPRTRVSVLEHAEYYPLREKIITFLENQGTKKSSVTASPPLEEETAIWKAGRVIMVPALDVQ